MVVIITGASRGIGFETAKYFAARSGFVIYALSRNMAGLGRLASESAGLNKQSKLIPLVFDLDSFIDEPEILLKRIGEKNLQVDILINNAGFLSNSPFHEFSHSDAERIFRVNFFAPALLIRQLLPFMGTGGVSHVVNISSMGGFQGSMKFPGLSYYSASKAALACLTECLAAEYAGRNIVFNCLALGAVQTEMLEEAFPGFRAQMNPADMGEFVGHFALHAHKHMRGKVIPVSLDNP